MAHYKRAMGDCRNHPIHSADTNDDCYTKSHPPQVNSDFDPDWILVMEPMNLGVA
jgi:hypothetical protein